MDECGCKLEISIISVGFIKIKGAFKSKKTPEFQTIA
jgi:hypothetical protein